MESAEARRLSQYARFFDDSASRNFSGLARAATKHALKISKALVIFSHLLVRATIMQSRQRSALSVGNGCVAMIRSGFCRHHGESFDV
jgi:hypothetical protein